VAHNLDCFETNYVMWFFLRIEEQIVDISGWKTFGILSRREDIPVASIVKSKARERFG